MSTVYLLCVQWAPLVKHVKGIYVFLGGYYYSSACFYYIVGDGTF